MNSVIKRSKIEELRYADCSRQSPPPLHDFADQNSIKQKIGDPETQRRYEDTAKGDAYCHTGARDPFYPLM